MPPGNTATSVAPSQPWTVGYAVSVLNGLAVVPVPWWCPIVAENKLCPKPVPNAPATPTAMAVNRPPAQTSGRSSMEFVRSPRFADAAEPRPERRLRLPDMNSHDHERPPHDSLLLLRRISRSLTVHGYGCPPNASAEMS